MIQQIVTPSKYQINDPIELKECEIVSVKFNQLGHTIYDIRLKMGTGFFMIAEDVDERFIKGKVEYDKDKG